MQHMLPTQLWSMDPQSLHHSNQYSKKPSGERLETMIMVVISTMIPDTTQNYSSKIFQSQSSAVSANITSPQQEARTILNPFDQICENLPDMCMIMGTQTPVQHSHNNNANFLHRCDNCHHAMEWSLHFH